MSKHSTHHRTHTCGQLTSSHVGQSVRLAGWINRVRDHGGIIFVDLRDHFGITQVVVQPGQDFYCGVDHWRLESVVAFSGRVEMRSAETANPRLPTGEIEVVATAMEQLSTTEELPFSVAKDTECDENVRLRYRFLDLRREALHRRIQLRSKITASIRNRLCAMGFLELQTPILTCSSPEGARDFLVPSRLHPGKFYALPQAPQIFKQLYMISGFDRYFQIAPCFRDEDARADRSPGEFYQVDMEMSFVGQEDVFAAIEELFSGLFPEFTSAAVTSAPFPRLTYHDSMLRYGTDKPDLRIPIEIRDATELFRDCGLNAFRQVVAGGGVVHVLPVHGAAAQPKSFFEGMIEFTQGLGGKGLAYMTWEADGVKSPIAKFLDPKIIDGLQQLGGMRPGDVMFFIADSRPAAIRIGGAVRTRLGNELGLVEKDAFRFCWITDFPMYELNEELGKIDFSHNPFSMPQGGMEALLTQDPLSIRAFQYDLVCNGTELSSGAIRNHRPDIMFKAFEIAGYGREEVEKRFGGLLRALHYGAPPHGGIAPGLDRVVMLLAGVQNIREVTAFPLNQTASDLLLGAPSEVTERQLRELHIRTAVPKKG